MKLALLLDALMSDNDPNRKTATEACLRSWANDVRLMRERNGISYEKIEGALIWSQNNPFWMSNILSMGKFREKYNQLSLKMKNNGNITKVNGVDEKMNEIFTGGIEDVEIRGSERKRERSAAVG